MKVRELMSPDVLTTGPETPLRDVAAILIDNQISGLPVCDAERHVMGVISEADILYKEHDPLAGRFGGPLAWIVDGSTPNDLVAKARAKTAREAMSAPAVTVRPYTSVTEAARLMTERQVNRLPVVQHDRLVGIVTRADLVRAFARPDEEIQSELRDEVLERTLWLDRGTVDVDVVRGNVQLAGNLPKRSDAVLLEGLASRVPGVVAVDSRLTWDADDMTRRERRKLERTRA
jgi:CBS-domain-containing membrane protein